MLGVILGVSLLAVGILASSNSVDQFSVKINEHLYNENYKSNAIWSPVSVYTSLLPFLTVASGQTLSELENLLGIQTPEGSEIEMSINDTCLQIRTGLFVQKEFTLNQRFSSIFESVQSFENANNLSDTINGWMKNVTNGLISTVVEHVKDNAKMIVVNGVVFKGVWRAKFRKEKTLIKSFHGIKSTTKVEMMHQTSVQNYGRFSTPNGTDFQVMKMGYRDSSMHVVLVVPDKTENLIDVYKYLKRLGRNRVGEILERLEPTELEIQVPKMRIESSVSIQQALEKAGLRSLFSQVTSNLSNMFEESNTTNTTFGLHVDEFVHKTVFELDEEGTTAGASTATIFLSLSALEPKMFVVNKPFIMFLRWEGKWTFFEGIVTDVEPLLSVIASNKTAPIQDQPDTKPIPIINNGPESNETSVESNKTTIAVLNGTQPEMKNGTENQMTRRNNSNDNWWVHNGPPEYLNNEVNKNQQQLQKNSRFQQPEPKDPLGIRFPNPATNATSLKYKLLMGTIHPEKVNPLFVSEE